MKNLNKIDTETKFMQRLIELQYDTANIDELTKISRKISWAKGWPQDKTAFWNSEAFMWKRKISEKVKKIIFEELKGLSSTNLDLGCGAYSYIKSVGFDISEKMLQNNENLISKVVGDVEKNLPFKDNEFDSVTAIFLLNYVKNYEKLFAEISCVLKSGGIFMMVLSAVPIKKWHQRQQVNDFSVKEWKEALEKSFKVKFYSKEDLYFLRCTKAKSY